MTGDPSRSNVQEMSVSEASRSVRAQLETAFAHIRVRGELGRVSRAASGHVYADLKDHRSVLSLIVWKHKARALTFEPEEGMEVIAEGRISTYAGRSVYQLITESLRPAGAGALMQILDERRRRLAAEGLFDPARKRPLRVFPSLIGVVTSPTGAVIEDILHRVSERFPVRVAVWPSLVQGPEAAGQIVAGIEGLNALDELPDVIIVARGGGSVEDLWAFNEENVVRAARASVIPLISAIGHETDTTLIDHAADVRAPTPTAAVELALPVTLGSVAERLTETWGRLGRMVRNRVASGAVRLSSAHLPVDIVQRARDRHAAVIQALGIRMRKVQHERSQAFIGASARLSPNLLREGVSGRGHRLSRAWHGLGVALDRVLSDRMGVVTSLGRVLDSVSHIGVMRRGYAVIRDRSGVVLRRGGQMRSGMPIRIDLVDGQVWAMVFSRTRTDE